MNYTHMIFKLKVEDAATRDAIIKQFQFSSDIWNHTIVVWDNIIKSAKEFDATHDNIKSNQFGTIDSGMILQGMRDSGVPYIFRLDNYNARQIVYFADKMISSYHTKKIDHLIKFNWMANKLPWIALDPNNIVVDMNGSSDMFAVTNFGNRRNNITLKFEVEPDPHINVRSILSSTEHCLAAFVFGKRTAYNIYDFYLVVCVPDTSNHKGSPVSILINSYRDYVYQLGKDPYTTEDLLEQYPDPEDYARELVFRVIIHHDPDKIFTIGYNHMVNFPNVVISKATSAAVERYGYVLKYLKMYGMYYQLNTYVANNNYSILDCPFIECGKGSLKASPDARRGVVECDKCGYTDYIVYHVLKTLVNPDTISAKFNEITNDFDEEFYLLDDPSDAFSEL